MWIRSRPAESPRRGPPCSSWDRAFIAFDFDADGKVLGIEFLGASRVLAEETLLSAGGASPPAPLPPPG